MFLNEHLRITNKIEIMLYELKIQTIISVKRHIQKRIPSEEAAGAEEEDVAKRARLQRSMFWALVRERREWRTRRWTLQNKKSYIRLMIRESLVGWVVGVRDFSGKNIHLICGGCFMWRCFILSVSAPTFVILSLSAGSLVLGPRNVWGVWVSNNRVYNK